MGRSSPRARWFPGYTVAAVSTVAQVLSAPGQTLLLSLLNLPLRDALGLDGLQLNTAYTLATVAASVPLVLVGRATDRWGPRLALAAIAVLFGAACSFMASIHSVAMLGLAFFALRLFGQGSLTLVSQHALAMWFHRRLGTLAGLQTVVMFAAWAVLPSAVQRAIDAWGWRTTWLGLGVIVAVVVSSLALGLLHDRPEDLGLRLDGDATESTRERSQFDRSQARRTSAFRLLAFGLVLSAMIGTAVMFEIQPLLSARGMDRADAAQLVGLWGLTMAILALPSGRLVDRIAPRYVLSAGCCGLGLGCAVLVVGASHGAAVGAVVSIATGQSLVTAVVGATTARYFGRDHHGAIRSSLARLAVLATGVGPLAFGLSDRYAGDYSAALSMFALACVPASLAALWLRSPTLGR